MVIQVLSVGLTFAQRELLKKKLDSIVLILVNQLNKKQHGQNIHSEWKCFTPFQIYLAKSCGIHSALQNAVSQNQCVALNETKSIQSFLWCLYIFGVRIGGTEVKSKKRHSTSCDTKYLFVNNVCVWRDKSGRKKETNRRWNNREKYTYIHIFPNTNN